MALVEVSKQEVEGTLLRGPDSAGQQWAGQEGSGQEALRTWSLVCNTGGGWVTAPA